MLLSFGGAGRLPNPPAPPTFPFILPFPFTSPSRLRGSSLVAGDRPSKPLLVVWCMMLRDRDRTFLPLDLLRLLPRAAGDFDLRRRLVFRSLWWDANEEFVEALMDRLGRFRASS